MYYRRRGSWHRATIIIRHLIGLWLRVNIRNLSICILERLRFSQYIRILIFYRWLRHQSIIHLVPVLYIFIIPFSTFLIGRLNIVGRENASTIANYASPPITVLFDNANMFTGDEYEVVRFGWLIGITCYVLIGKVVDVLRLRLICESGRQDGIGNWNVLWLLYRFSDLGNFSTRKQT